MAKRAKASEPSEPEAAIVRVDEPSAPADALVEPEANAEPEAPRASSDESIDAVSATSEDASNDLPGAAPRDGRADVPPILPPPPRRASSGPSFGERVGNFFRFLFRLVLLLIALAVIGVALYYLIPQFYQSFVRPVEQNTAHVRALQSWQQQTVQDLADLQTKLQTLENVQNKHDRSLTELDQRLSDIETEIAARTESLATLEQMQTELQKQNETVSVELERQINLLKVMELLSRARLFMYQSNFGLAREDVQIARDLLATVRPDAPKSLGDELDAVVLRLDLTLSNLPDFPVAASDDLDIAWQILLTGQPLATPTLSPTPTAVATLSSTPGASDVTVTPTPVGTLQPTATQ